MFPANFGYVAARSVEEALQLMASTARTVNCSPAAIA